MSFKGTKVLILEGYARQSLPLIKAFNKLGCHVSALCSTKLDVAYVSRYTNKKILGICDRDNAKKTTEQIRELLKTGNYDMVVPTVDFSAALLAENKTEFSQYARVVSNDWDVYQIAADKVQTMEICMKNRIPCPYTILNVESIEQVLGLNISYPIVIKPRVGYGAIGFRKIASKKELKTLFLNGNDPSMYVFQEYIPQTDLQYECAMFIDNNNKVKTSLVFSKNRWFPINGGSSTLNITVERPDIVESCTRLLQAINWRGPADIDLIQDPRDNIAKIMEINPRVSGSVKICFISGVNQAKQMLELLYACEVTKYDKYRIGQRLRCSQTDLLWFMKSPNRFRSNPSWFSLKNTKDHTFSIDDPIPWFAFTLQAITRYKNEMRKRIKTF
jgi:D-aspartate ligase